jgi:hypothetical protein
MVVYDRGDAEAVGGGLEGGHRTVLVGAYAEG